jgi:type II secretion system protein H
MLATNRHELTVPPRFRRGFTLVEVLVVVVLIAITLSVAFANFAPDERDVVRDEAARLAASLQQAQDEAVITGVTFAWRGAADGYEFLRRDADRNWVPLGPTESLSPRRLPSPLKVLDVEIEGRQVAAGALVVLSPSGRASMLRVVLAGLNERVAVELSSKARVVPANGS